MAFDGIVMHAAADELKSALCGGKIDKIHQPERDTITMAVRTPAGVYKLLLCANPSCARVHLTDYSYENPMSPPMLCMLMRKHLSGGRITQIEQIGFDRVMIIHVESYDEMNELGEKLVICELMGKHSNIILTDKNMKIIDSVFHVDFTVSSVRQILPGLVYTAPPSQGKDNPLCADKDDVKRRLTESDIPMYRQIMDSYCGISPIMAREAVFAACGDTDKTAADATAAQIDMTAYVFCKMIQNAADGAISPCVIADSESRKLIDFSALDVRQFESLGEVTHYETISEAAEVFYRKKAAMQSLKQKSADLTRFINNNLERCKKKLALENDILENAKKRDKYKMYGDLITANIYRIQPGDREAVCENYYSESGEKVKIPLKYDLTPAQNAQRYYIRYNKEKTAGEQTVRQRALNLKELDYLESVKEAVSLAETGAEIALIREELTEQGYLKNKGKKKKTVKKLPAPMHFVSDDGYDIYVGKNNRQNDYVTLKLSRSTDIWFHTKGIHGSHAIVKTSDAMTVPERTYVQAAALAAYYSKARASQSVPVDYTEVKNVKKPSGARPGMVIYVNYNTIYANPSEELVNRLKKD